MNKLANLAIVSRLLPSLCALSAFGAMTLLYVFGPRQLYMTILHYDGLDPYRFPFLDFHNSLAAWQCTRQGIDVIGANPCDDLNRGYIYGPWWMALSFIPFGIEDTGWLGWILGFCFLASFTFLPPVSGRWGLIIMIIATLSPMVAFAVERANADIMIFMLAVAAGNVMLSQSGARFTGYALIIFAGLFKYYPITALIVAAREGTSTFLKTILIAGSVIVLFVALYFDELRRALPLIPGGPYSSDLFSAKNLPFGIAQFFLQLPPTSLGSRSVGTVIFFLFLMFQMLGLSLMLRRTPADPLSALSEHERVFLVMGCALMVGCFFMGPSTYYRGIALLLVLPGLLALGRQWSLARFTVGAILFLMWEECARWTLLRTISATDDTASFPIYNAFWVARELLWWWVITLMLLLLIDFLTKTKTALGVHAHSWTTLSRLLSSLRLTR